MNPSSIPTGGCKKYKKEIIIQNSLTLGVKWYYFSDLYNQTILHYSRITIAGDLFTFLFFFLDLTLCHPFQIMVQ
jgi:hypothetical protein